MDVILLPKKVAVKIFLLLTPISLHLCRTVCQSWNKFILKEIWNSEKARTILKRHLSQNWSIENPKYHKEKRIIEFGELECPYILDSTPNYVLIGGQNKAGNITVKLNLVNTKSTTQWCQLWNLFGFFRKFKKPTTI